MAIHIVEEANRRFRLQKAFWSKPKASPHPDAYLGRSLTVPLLPSGRGWVSCCSRTTCMSSGLLHGL